MKFDVYLPETYGVLDTDVSFKTKNKDLKWIFDRAEEICNGNIRKFSDYKVLIEGAKYNGVWLETQPMGGEMYAKRDLEVALSNILIFLRYQRMDGRMAGMITDDGDYAGISAHYDWLQGVFLPHSALKLYYLINKNEEYLKLLYTSLEKFDEYLWKYRDSDNDGCLEAWSIWDTGDDNCTIHMLDGLKMPDHGGYGKSTPPQNYGSMPYESPQMMGYSYAMRDVLAKISKILNNGKEEYWLKKAESVQQKVQSYLWDDEKKACFMRNNRDEFIYALTQENIKCMYSGIFTQQMADDFISQHLMNENEFWTPYPLPSIAVNDPYFHVNQEYSNCKEKLSKLNYTPHDIDDNSWSGPIHGLTYQRSIDALINYGHHTENVMIGKRLLELISKTKVFKQQYNPYTGEYCKEADDGFGPTTLAALEFISLMYGVNISYDTVFWTNIDNTEFEYVQKLNNKSYKLSSKGQKVCGYIDDRLIFTAMGKIRIKTDLEGKILSLFGICENAEHITLQYGDCTYESDIKPNEEYAMENKKFRLIKAISFGK